MRSSSCSVACRRRGTLLACQALKLAWVAAPALASPTSIAGSRGRRDGVARVFRVVSLSDNTFAYQQRAGTQAATGAASL
eukprot:1365940-Pleurochrysis_carterae.AAC.1